MYDVANLIKGHKGPSVCTENKRVVWVNISECKVSLSQVEEKCHVVYTHDITQSLEQYFRSGQNNFYFSEVRHVTHFLLSYPLRPQWDIRPQQSFATRSCPWLRPKPLPTTAPSLSARPSLFVATSSLAVPASFSQVVSILVPLWGCCLRAFVGRVLAILAACV